MTSLEDFLLEHINLHITGPAFQQLEKPLDCYTPVHNSYTRSTSSLNPPSTASLLGHIRGAESPALDNIQASIPGGSLRTVPSTAASNGHAVVYDRDVMTMWKLHGTMQAYEVYF